MWAAVGAALGLAAVVIGAAGGHGAGRGNPNFQLAQTYHFAHAVALFAAGLALPAWAGTAHLLGMMGCAALAFGTVAFCGTLYAGVFGLPRLPGVAPVGGIALMAGWLLLAVAAAL